MPASSDITVADVRVTLPHNVALHARPAADFVRTAMGFSSEVWVSSGEREVDARSLLSILALGAQAGTTLSIRAEGADAAAAVDALAAAVARFRD